MQDARRAVRARLSQYAATRPGLVARLRLFGLLILLVPLFAGLRYMIHEGMPRVEVRFVPQDVPVLVPVERIVERVVERVIYVPVPADGAPDLGSPSPLPTDTPTPSAADPGAAEVPGIGAAGAGGGALAAVGVLSSGLPPGAVAPGGPLPGGPGDSVALGAPTPSITDGVVSVVQSEGGGRVTGAMDGGGPPIAVPVVAPLSPAVLVRATPRPRTTPTVVIATEDRLGTAGVARPGQQTPSRAQSRTGQGDTDDSRSAGSAGNGKSTDDQSGGGGHGQSSVAAAGSSAGPPGVVIDSSGAVAELSAAPAPDELGAATPTATPTAPAAAGGPVGTMAPSSAPGDPALRTAGHEGASVAAGAPGTSSATIATPTATPRPANRPRTTPPATSDEPSHQGTPQRPRPTIPAPAGAKD